MLVMFCTLRHGRTTRRNKSSTANADWKFVEYNKLDHARGLFRCRLGAALPAEQDEGTWGQVRGRDW